MLISSARQKDKLPLCSQAFSCLNPVPNVYSTTPVEVLLELLLLTRNPSWLVLKIYGKANFLKMLIDVDHDNLRTVLLQTPNTSHSYLFYNGYNMRPTKRNQDKFSFSKRNPFSEE